MKMWWTNQSWANFEKKQKCFVDFYDQIEIDGLKVRRRLMGRRKGVERRQREKKGCKEGGDNKWKEG